jgi:hypothetical protein
MKLLRFMIGAVLAALAYGCSGGASQISQDFGQQEVTAFDNSDWFSLSGVGNSYKMDGKALWQQPSPQLLNIAGITLGPGMEKDAVAKFGRAVRINRHKWGGIRQQICYRSVKEPPTAYLVFEIGRASDAFYLIAGDAPQWQYIGDCVKSPVVTKALSTATGLQLGLTRAELTDQLGPPSASHPDSMVWNFEGPNPPVVVRAVFSGNAAIMVSVWYEDRGSGVLGD